MQEAEIDEDEKAIVEATGVTRARFNELMQQVADALTDTTQVVDALKIAIQITNTRGELAILSYGIGLKIGMKEGRKETLTKLGTVI